LLLNIAANDRWNALAMGRHRSRRVARQS